MGDVEATLGWALLGGVIVFVVWRSSWLGGAVERGYGSSRTSTPNLGCLTVLKLAAITGLALWLLYDSGSLSSRGGHVGDGGAGPADAALIDARLIDARLIDAGPRDADPHGPATTAIDAGHEGAPSTSAHSTAAGEAGRPHHASPPSRP